MQGKNGWQLPRCRAAVVHLVIYFVWKESNLKWECAWVHGSGWGPGHLLESWKEKDWMIRDEEVRDRGTWMEGRGWASRVKLSHHLLTTTMTESLTNQVDKMICPVGIIQHLSPAILELVWLMVKWKEWLKWQRKKPHGSPTVWIPIYKVLLPTLGSEFSTCQPQRPVLSL